MKNLDFVPGWLEDPAAYAQAPNLDMSTVAVVALANLLAAVFCVTIFEFVRRKSPRTYAPKEALAPGTTPDIGLHRGKAGPPLTWVRPLMALSDEEVLRCGGFDVLVYLRFVKMATKIFAAFAPYAFVVLLPVNASVYFLTGSASSPSLKDEKEINTGETNTINSFNRLSMASMPAKDSRMWFHCLGVYILTAIALRFLQREAKWYTQLRHRFLTQETEARHRSVMVRQIPVELRSSQRLADYFAKLYPGKVCGAICFRNSQRLEALESRREAAAARAERLDERRNREKLRANEYSRTHTRFFFSRCRAAFGKRLEDCYDPRAWTLEPSHQRLIHHKALIRKLDAAIRAEQARHLALGCLVARPQGLPLPSPLATTASQDLSPQCSATTKKITPNRNDASSQHEETKFTDADIESASAITDTEDDEEYGLLSEEERSALAGGAVARLCRRAKWSAGCSFHIDDTERQTLLGDKGVDYKEKEMLDVGIVTFNCFAGAAVATQVFHAATPGGMVAGIAPEPCDIFWSNLRLSQPTRATRRVIANILVALLLIFYVVPVTLISLVLSEQAIIARWPSMETLAQHSLTINAGLKMLQPAGLILLMLLLPPLFLGLGFWEGRLSWSANTLAQLSRYYSFQITNVLLVTTVAGSLVKCLQRILDHPKDTLTLLAQSLPQVCAFFSCYVFIKALGGLPLELCRGVAAGQHIAKRSIYPAYTSRDRAAVVLGLRDVNNPGFWSYGKFAAQDLLVVALLMTYAVMAPIILLPGLLFFALAQVVYRHQLLFVYLPIFESGGLLWPRIYRRTLFSLFILQFTMTGLFFLKAVYKQGYACLALSVATYIFKVRSRHLFANSSSVAHHLPIELATAVDDAIRHDRRDPHADDAILWHGLHKYLQPPLHSPSSPS